MTAAYPSAAIKALVDLLAPDDAALEAVLVQAQVGDAATRSLLLQMLGSVPAEPAGPLAEIVRLHSKEALGEQLAGGEWRAARRAAVALGDAAEPLAQARGQLAEAAAWSISGTTSILVDCFRALAEFNRLTAQQDLGWSEVDNARALACLERIHAELAAAPGEEGVDRRAEIPGLFAAAEPELESRFSAQLDASNVAYRTLSETLLDALRSLAGGAA